MELRNAELAMPGTGCSCCCELANIARLPSGVFRQLEVWRTDAGPPFIMNGDPFRSQLVNGTTCYVTWDVGFNRGRLTVRDGQAGFVYSETKQFNGQHLRSWYRGYTTGLTGVQDFDNPTFSADCLPPFAVSNEFATGQFIALPCSFPAGLAPIKVRLLL